MDYLELDKIVFEYIDPAIGLVRSAIEYTQPMLKYIDNNKELSGVILAITILLWGLKEDGYINLPFNRKNNVVDKESLEGILGKSL